MVCQTTASRESRVFMGIQLRRRATALTRINGCGNSHGMAPKRSGEITSEQLEADGRPPEERRLAPFSAAFSVAVHRHSKAVAERRW
jgi:hypothetical protein